jgi:sortase A
MAAFLKGSMRIERWLLAAGLLFWAVLAAGLLHRYLGSRIALMDFEKAKTTADRAVPDALGLVGEGEVDFSLWSEKRVRAYRESLAARKGAPMAVLSITRLGIRVPVFEGTDEWTLNRGVGWIAGTARPDEKGNVGIAGHRDGFFRRLKDISPGDAIEIATFRSTRTYTVDGIEIVTPDDVGVLRARSVPSLTLVTCYPFYFMGDAPQRFILHAALKE